MLPACSCGGLGDSAVAEAMSLYTHTHIQELLFDSSLSHLTPAHAPVGFLSALELQEVPCCSFLVETQLLLEK